MTYIIKEPEIVDMVKTTDYCKVSGGQNFISGRLKEIPDEFDAQGFKIKAGRRWFIIYARTKNVGTMKDITLTTKVSPELLQLIPEDIDRVEFAFLDRIHSKIKCRDCLFCQKLNSKEYWCIDFECNLSKKQVESPRHCLHFTPEVPTQ